MLKNEQAAYDKERKKAKIRERYKGNDTDLVEIIPAKATPGFYDDVERRVAVYVRVSTDNIQQTSSYELQKNYYEDMVKKYEKWTLVGIYADEGITGMSLKHRDSFNKMINDCRAGLVDMIITKSVSRFARNMVDCISIVRELRNLVNPVAIFFETEHIYTLNDATETQLGITATMAQEESHTKSAIMNISYDMRFSHGILLTPVLLGYDHDEDSNLIINDDEATTVRLIFFMYICGYSCSEIADKLSALYRITKKGRTEWNAGSVLGILRNEKYCGDVLARKSFTPDYLNHKSRKNRGERNKYLWKNQHEPIISRDDFIAVQHMINNAKYGRGCILPELKIISEGELKGFVSVNPRWAGFRAEEYISAAKNVYVGADNEWNNFSEIAARGGDFDLREYEIARAEFFNTVEKITVTFSVKKTAFGISCIKKFGNIHLVEMLIHPIKKQIIIRPSTEKSANCIKWAFISGSGRTLPRQISGSAYLKTLFEIFGWNTDFKYRIYGFLYRNESERFLIFDVKDAEMLIPHNLLDSEIKSENNVGKFAVAYPDCWNNSFGEKFYVHKSLNYRSDKPLSISEKTIKSREFDGLNLTGRENAEAEINGIISDIEKENHGYGK